MEANPRAFPHPPLINAHGLAITHGDFGMTLRDYFAGQALQGMLSNTDIAKDARDQNDSTEAAQRWCARGAYQFADAMLAERSKP